MDIVIKIILSCFIVFTLSVNVYFWIKTWVTPIQSTPNKNPILLFLTTIILLFPHTYLVIKGLEYIGLNQKYFLFVVIIIGINQGKTLISDRFHKAYITNIHWETILYIPGIIHIFNN